MTPELKSGDLILEFPETCTVLVKEDFPVLVTRIRPRSGELWVDFDVISATGEFVENCAILRLTKKKVLTYARSNK